MPIAFRNPRIPPWRALDSFAGFGLFQIVGGEAILGLNVDGFVYPPACAGRAAVGRSNDGRNRPGAPLCRASRCSFGLAVGPVGFDLLPRSWYEFLASVALTMVAFLLGGRLSLAALRSHGKEILVVSLVVVALTACLVGIGPLAVGVAVTLALLLAGIATATAPAATQDVVEQEHAAGPFISGTDYPALFTFMSGEWLGLIAGIIRVAIAWLLPARIGSARKQALPAE